MHGIQTSRCQIMLLDVYVPGQWTYAFFIPSKLSDSFRSGALYDTANGTVQLVNVNGLPNPSNWIFRDGQAVQFIRTNRHPQLAGARALGSERSPLTSMITGFLATHSRSRGQ
jgi:hypothetical protein